MTASPLNRKTSFLLSVVVLAGCGRYAEFTLPPPATAGSAPSFRWAPNALPVIGRGNPGEWDAVDALNPSIVEYQDKLYNFYSGFDGKTWHTGLAVSTDGITWIKKGKLLSPDAASWHGDDYIAANGSALAGHGEVLYWYQAGRDVPRIGLARWNESQGMRGDPKYVLGPGPRGSWNERGVADPDVIRAGTSFYVFYMGIDRAHRQRLGVARSGDGVKWENLRSNPILELGGAGSFDENGLGEPAVWAAAGSYWMMYTGRDRKENRRLGFAQSADGVHWKKIDRPIIGGDQAWDSKVVCDPSVLPGVDGSIRVWFGGGDVARPDERLNGQIGFALLR